MDVSCNICVHRFFKAVCLLATTIAIGYWCYKFSLDEDICLIDFKTYNDQNQNYSLTFRCVTPFSFLCTNFQRIFSPPSAGLNCSRHEAEKMVPLCQNFLKYLMDFECNHAIILYSSFQLL